MTTLFEIPKKRPTWVSKLSSLELNEEFMTPYKNGKTISPVISKKMRIIHPERSFITRKKLINKGNKEISVLVIKRTK